MARVKLEAALTSVDWNTNVTDFLNESSHADIISQANLRLAVWSKQFENLDIGNPAISFIREMQVASHHVPALAALAMYKPAASAMRIVFETALYYTYFRKHPSELATLIRDRSYYISKSEIISYHKIHTLNFKSLEQRFGLLNRIDEWYGFISSLVHGQIPGQWNTHTELAKIGYAKVVANEVSTAFQRGEQIVHDLFFCTVGKELWSGFSSTSKRQLIAGMPAEKRSSLGIDAA